LLIEREADIEIYLINPAEVDNNQRIYLFIK
jgi:hypothetical protein